MDNIQETEKTAGRRKVAKALQNSTVSKDGNWRTFEEVPCLMQYKGRAFYLRKRIDGDVYTRSLETDVFSVARERIPKKVQEILDEIDSAAKADASPKPEAAPQVVPVTVGDGIAKQVARQVAGPFKKQTHRYHETCRKRLVEVWPELPEMLITAVSEDMCLAWATKERGAVSTNYFNNLRHFLSSIGMLPRREQKLMNQRIAQVGQKPHNF